MKDVTERYLQAGVPIYGVGIQSHLHYFDTHLLKVCLQDNVYEPENS